MGGGDVNIFGIFALATLFLAKSPFGLKLINPSTNIRDKGRKDNVKSLWKAFNK
jgi:hypothetical protein